MGIHGVDADEQIRKSTQPELYALVKDSDRLLCF